MVVLRGGRKGGSRGRAARGSCTLGGDLGSERSLELLLRLVHDFALAVGEASDTVGASKNRVRSAANLMHTRSAAGFATGVVRGRHECDFSHLDGVPPRPQRLFHLATQIHMLRRLVLEDF